MKIFRVYFGWAQQQNVQEDLFLVIWGWQKNQWLLRACDTRVAADGFWWVKNMCVVWLSHNPNNIEVLNSYQFTNMYIIRTLFALYIYSAVKLWMNNFQLLYIYYVRWRSNSFLWKALRACTNTLTLLCVHSFWSIIWRLYAVCVRVSYSDENIEFVVLYLLYMLIT